MTTEIRPNQPTVPAHGSRSGYLRGCGCQPCRTAHYRYMAKWRLDAARGQRRRTDPGPARNHVQRLLDAGWLQMQITRAAGLNHRVVGALIAGSYQTINKTTAAAILAVPVGPPPQQRNVDATGTVRRVRALIAIGWPIAHLAPHFGLHRDALARITRGERQLIRAETADRVAAAYRRLAAIPGTSARARATAARWGWAGPMAWGEDIDDPKAQPEADVEEQPLDRGELAAHRRQEIQHLVRFGVSEDEIAARLGMARGYVHDTLRNLRKAA